MDLENTSHHQQASGDTTPMSLFTMDSSSNTNEFLENEMRSNGGGGETMSKQHGAISLRQQVMLNQFCSITGCSCEQALQFLVSSEWQYQVIISLISF